MPECSFQECTGPATHIAHAVVLGCRAEIPLCLRHTGRWRLIVAGMETGILGGQMTLYPDPDPIDKPVHVRPDDPIQLDPTVRTGTPAPDTPVRTDSHRDLTCEICGLRIVRREGAWAAIFEPAQYMSEQDARRIEQLATNHEHRPG